MGRLEGILNRARQGMARHATRLLWAARRHVHMTSARHPHRHVLESASTSERDEATAAILAYTTLHP